MSSGPVYNPTDHTLLMQQLLPMQFQGLPVLGSFIKNIGCQLNDLDEFFGQLFTKLNLQNAGGVQLDGLGTLLGQSRNGLSNNDYKTLLQARIAAYQSKGSVENLIQIMLTLAAAKVVQVIESQPASVAVVTSGEGNPALSNNDIITAIYQAKPAGVLLTLNATIELPAFQCDLPATANNAGFDTGHVAGPY